MNHIDTGGEKGIETIGKSNSGSSFLLMGKKVNKKSVLIQALAPLSTSPKSDGRILSIPVLLHHVRVLSFKSFG